MKTASFYTLGCKVNQYETQAIREQFIKAGFDLVEDNADICVINTCTVTLSADRKSRHLIRLARKKNPDSCLVITGCYVEEDAEEVRKIPGVDLIVKNRQKSEIIELIQTPPLAAAVPAGIDRIYSPLRISNFSGRSRAFVKIQDGCNNSCSYCKVTLVRGTSRSRLPGDIVDEVGRLSEAGFIEIVLVGVHLGAYGLDLAEKANLSGIVELIEEIDGIKRIRLSSLDPRDLTPELIGKLAGSKKLCPHLHIPLQSGDDFILKRMNRNYRREQIRQLVNNVHNACPGLSLTLDIIAGFPGEEEEHFTNTLKLLKEIVPARVHIFPYSRRKGTLAAQFSNTITEEEIKDRCRRLRQLAGQLSLKYRSQFLNQGMEVLVESRRDNKTGLLCGYTDNYLKVSFKGRDSLKNRLVPMKIIDVTIDNTIGKVQ